MAKNILAEKSMQIKKALIIRDVDKNLIGNSEDTGDYWKDALVNNGISDVDYYDFQEHINLNKIYLNKVSYSLTRRQPFDVFRKAEKRMLAFLEGKRYDLILFIKTEFVTEGLLKKIKAKNPGTLLVNIYPDNVFFHFYAYKAIPAYDYFFVKDTYVHKELAKSGYTNCFYLPMAFSPKYQYRIDVAALKKEDVEKYSSDVSFVGSIYPQRQRIFENFNGFDLKLWGGSVWDSVDKGSWILQKHIRGAVDDETKRKIFACSKININTQHYQNDIFGCNNRLFEICACGGFQLTDYKVDLEDLFVIGKELVAFKDAKEMREKTEYYLKHPAERKRIAEAGYKRVMKDHSYTKRIEEVLRVIRSGR
jgi:hypothetical protein